MERDQCQSEQTLAEQLEQLILRLVPEEEESTKLSERDLLIVRLLPYVEEFPRLATDEALVQELRTLLSQPLGQRPTRTRGGEAYDADWSSAEQERDAQIRAKLNQRLRER